MKKFLLSISLILFLSFGLVFADTNGIWVDSKDIRVGTFGSDEGDSSSDYIFQNPILMNKTLTINTNSVNGIYVNSSNADGVTGITYGASKSAIYGWAKNSGAFSGFFDGGKFVVNSGNVGIGTQTPRTNLEVNGRIFVTDHGVSPSSGVGMFSSYNPAVNSGLIQGYDYNLGSAKNIALQAVGGNVGIGTSNPSAKLDVNGNIRVRGKVSCDKLSTDGNGNLVCDIDRVNDADFNPTNEIQALNSVLSTGNDAGSSLIRNVKNPILTQDVATKGYVDSNIPRIIVGKGLQKDSSNNFGLINCGVNQILKYDGINWNCGVDVDTRLSEVQVDAYVANNGYLTNEVDPTVLASVKDGVSWAEVTGKPAGFADNVDNVCSFSTESAWSACNAVPLACSTSYGDQFKTKILSCLNTSSIVITNLKICSIPQTDSALICSGGTGGGF